VRNEVAAARTRTRTETQWCNVVAALRLAEGDPDGALDALLPVFDGSAETIHPNLEIEARLLEALARDRLRDADASERALEHALDLAEPERRIWIMTVVPVRELLERHPRHRTRHAAFVAELLDGHVGAEPAAGAESRRLSDRELSVLRYLPTNLSAPEIASELFLSVHTVKTHIRHIYAKLEAHRRKEAVEQARALGLLAPPGSRQDAVSR
jgi:LuxR family maltose regulon positive regulatory protein